MDKLKFSEAAFTGKNWSREQLQLAFYFYCQTPFGQLHGKNPKVVELAKLMGRTPGALAMKCGNFASLDPVIRESGRSGLGNASRLDKDIWDEFHANWEQLAVECEQLMHILQCRRPTPATESRSDDRDKKFALTDYTGDTREAIIQQRIRQTFFRNAVLSSYGGRCCISGVSESRFLVASHIIPWREDKVNRLNPANGLCLSVIHDKAFDCHLFTLDDNFRIMLSRKLRATKDEFLQEVFGHLNDEQIRLPEKFLPPLEFLTKHRTTMLSLYGD